MGEKDELMKMAREFCSCAESGCARSAYAALETVERLELLYALSQEEEKEAQALCLRAQRRAKHYLSGAIDG